MTAPDYEMPMDADMDNMYMVTVMADDGTYMDTHDVTVMVTNVDEMGMVTLSDMQPRVGTPIMATLADLDGDITGTTWQWASSSDMSDLGPTLRTPHLMPIHRLTVTRVCTSVPRRCTRTDDGSGQEHDGGCRHSR